MFLLDKNYVIIIMLLDASLTPRLVVEMNSGATVRASNLKIPTLTLSKVQHLHPNPIFH